MTKAIPEMKSDTEQIDEIGVAVQSWLWVQVELMAWQLSRLEHLNGIQWSSVQVSLRPIFYNYFKESFSGEYHMYFLYFLIFLKINSFILFNYFINCHFFTIILSRVANGAGNAGKENLSHSTFVGKGGSFPDTDVI